MDELPFKDKIKTIYVMGSRTPDKVVTETRHEDGYLLKHTTEGDPVNGKVTQTEHAKGERLDCNFQPATFSVQVVSTQAVPEEG